MAELDIEGLLVPIDGDSPCGIDLTAEAGFYEFEQSVEGTPERQRADGSIVSAEPPDWKSIKSNALGLLQKSKDIRVITNLTRALASTDGYGGFRDGLKLLHGVLEKYWDSIYPQLDADDDMDPTERINAISSLNDYSGTLVHLSRATLVEFPPVGSFSLRDYRIANGLMPPPSGMTDLPDPQLIDAAFRECELDQLLESVNILTEAQTLLSGIDAALMSRAGAEHAPDLSALLEALKEPLQVIQGELEKRGVATDASGATSDEAGAVARTVGVPGAINNRDDAMRALDKVAEYFVRNEPSSPVPLLLDRAKRIVSMNFMDIVEDLAPDGLEQAYIRTGVKKLPEQEY